MSAPAQAERNKKITAVWQLGYSCCCFPQLHWLFM